MIIDFKLIISVENKPHIILNPQLLKEQICAHLKGHIIKDKSVIMTIKDAGLCGDGLPITFIDITPEEV